MWMTGMVGVSWADKLEVRSGCCANTPSCRKSMLNRTCMIFEMNMWKSKDGGKAIKRTIRRLQVLVGVAWFTSKSRARGASATMGAAAAFKNYIAACVD
mmetsp:Transcript_4258/g.9574  ORF Transcript_4258/g.9574 Transcript_4258/m.9574 type:complete len:99 (+) Transcript_4258:94-390(+)